MSTKICRQSSWHFGCVALRSLASILYCPWLMSRYLYWSQSVVSIVVIGTSALHIRTYHVRNFFYILFLQFLFVVIYNSTFTRNSNRFLNAIHLYLFYTFIVPFCYLPFYSPYSTLPLITFSYVDARNRFIKVHLVLL